MKPIVAESTVALSLETKAEGKVLEYAFLLLKVSHKKIKKTFCGPVDTERYFNMTTGKFFLTIDCV